MEKDFYLPDRALAAYLEKDWFDLVFKSNPRAVTLNNDYHERLVKFLSEAFATASFKPRNMLEIGSSLGRTFYEVCVQLESVEDATLIEPSRNLFSTFEKIFGGKGGERFPLLTESPARDNFTFDAGAIQAACAHVKVSHLNVPFQKCKSDLGKFDLVIASNVIDQCEDHVQLAELLRNSAAPGGVVALSCTYQWNEKYIGNAPLEPIADIKDLFPGWEFLGETNLPFHVRAHERYWMTFLSHAVIMRNV